MNLINKRQNESQQIDRLAAQRFLYSQAKKIQIIQLAIAIPATLIIPLAIRHNPGFEIYGYTWGILATLAELVLATGVESVKTKAAQIQELFDCYVLDLPWNKLHVGNRPTPEEVHVAAQKFNKSKGDRTKLLNWYSPSVEALPAEIARIICQRSSCWWDANLRRRYSSLLLVVLIVISVLSVAIGLMSNFTLAQYISAVAAPLLPLYVFAVKQIMENNKAANSVDQLRKHAEGLWESALSFGAGGVKGSQELQCEIFSHRKQSPVIFDWVYFILRNQQEEEMNIGAEAMVKQAQIKIAKPRIKKK